MLELRQNQYKGLYNILKIASKRSSGGYYSDVCQVSENSFRYTNGHVAIEILGKDYNEDNEEANKYFYIDPKEIQKHLKFKEYYGFTLKDIIDNCEYEEEVRYPNFNKLVVGLRAADKFVIINPEYYTLMLKHFLGELLAIDFTHVNYQMANTNMIYLNLSTTDNNQEVITCKLYLMPMRLTKNNQ